MKLTKNCKTILDTVKNLKPNNGIQFYTVEYVAMNTDLDISAEEFLGILNMLAELHAIQWGDEQHSAFSLTEIGREYKQIGRIETAEKWRERAYGFFAAILVNLLLSGLLNFFGL